MYGLLLLEKEESAASVWAEREKVEKNLFRQLDRTTVANRVIRVVGESTLILIFAQAVGMDGHTWH